MAMVDAAPGLDILDPGRPVFFSGQLMTAQDGTPQEIGRAEEILEAEIAGWLAERRVPAAFCSAACGGDILFAEAALDAGIPLHLILPFAIDRFAELSVRIGDGWETRYLRCLDGAASVVELWCHEVAKGVVDHHFLRANRHMAGEAIFAAHALQTRPLMLAVLDVRQATSLSGARNIAGEFSAHGHEVCVITSPLERKRLLVGLPTPDPFAPVVFAFACAQNGNDALAALLPRLGFSARMMKDRRLAGQKVCKDWAEAFTLASLMSRRAQEGELSTRVVCDYGPVLQRNGSIDAYAVLGLEAAFDLTAAAAGDVFATSAFTMAELAMGGDPGRYVSINLAVGRDGGDRFTLRGARQVFRVGISL